MATKKLRPVHPGDILQNDFLEPLGLTAYRLAKQLGVSRPTITQIAAASFQSFLFDLMNGRTNFA